MKLICVYGRDIVSIAFNPLWNSQIEILTLKLGYWYWEVDTETFKLIMIFSYWDIDIGHSPLSNPLWISQIEISLSVTAAFSSLTIWEAVGIKCSTTWSRQLPIAL